MGIKHTISGTRRNTPLTYGQELARARKTVESILRLRGNMRGNKQLIKYIESVAKLKARGEDLSIPRLKEVSDKIIVQVEWRIIRFINLYLNSLSPTEARRFIKEKFEILKLEVNKNAV